VTPNELAAMLRRNPQLVARDQSNPPTSLDAMAPAEVDAAMLALNAGALGEAQPVGAGLVSQSIVLPLPPSANTYWRYTSNGVYVSEAAENYKAGVKLRATLQRMTPFGGEVAMYVHVYRAQKRGDLDNFAKVLGDALNGVTYHDDSQVIELHMWRHDDKGNPRCEVEVRKVTL
jgi:Holliday junction resolvase RusA-like endonuclease